MAERMSRGNSLCGRWLRRAGDCARSSSPGTTSGLRLAFKLVTVPNGIGLSANFSTLAVVSSRRAHTTPNLSGTPPATFDLLRMKPYNPHKRNVGFPYALPDGMGSTRVFHLPCLIVKPPHHRDHNVHPDITTAIRDAFKG